MRILLGEDEPRLHRSLTQALEEQGYVVEGALDGAAVLEMALATDYDAVVLDVMMPGRDGWSVLEQLRRSKRTPVLMLTARDATRDRVKGLDLGADDYLVKPFDLPELFARLRALIRRAAGSAGNAIDIGDVVIDLRARTVRWAGAYVPLTATEFSIVEYLALHRGRVVSRSELYDHLRGDADDSFSNVMDVHVAGIRRKLGASFISTRRGQGYCIE